MKKWFLEFIQILSFSVFVGVAAYGVFMYWGGETQEKIPVFSSLLLGFGAVICIIVVIIVGGVLDNMAAADDAQKQSETGIND